MLQPTKSLAAAVSAALLVISGSIATGAAEEKKQPAAGLPGVESDYSIVQAAPEPEDLQADDADRGKRLRVGNWDVEISGEISYQIGTSSYGR